jgi:hypothetical protein
VFEEATRLAVRELLSGRYWKRRLPVKPQPGTDLSSAIKPLEAAISSYFTEQEGRGKACALKYEGHDLLLRQMLIDSGIDVTGHPVAAHGEPARPAA